MGKEVHMTVRLMVHVQVVMKGIFIYSISGHYRSSYSQSTYCFFYPLEYTDTKFF